MKHRTLCAQLLILCCIGAVVHAQPSDAQIKKDVANSGVIKFSFTKSSGTRQWNKDLGNWEYVRGVELIRASNIPGVNLKVVGDAVYQQQSASSYTYWKFRVLSNSYEGLPEPTRDEVLGVISSNWPAFYGFLFGETLKIIKAPDLAADPQWNWDSPKTLDLRLYAQLEMVWQGKNVAIVDQFFTVRLFRDDMKGPWQRFIVTSRDDQKVLSQKSYTYAEITEFKKNSIERTLNEQMASAKAASLPRIMIPHCNNTNDLALFVHNILRNGDEAQLRAVLLKLLSPRFFESGSTTQLSAYAEQTVQEIVAQAYGGSITYKDEYCQTFVPTNLSSQKSVYIPSCVQQVVSSISADFFNVGYVEGKPQTELRITEIQIRVRKDADAKAFLQSFSDRKRLCPND